MVKVSCIGDMLYHSTSDHSTMLETLRGQPRQIYGCVDADRSEVSPAVHARRKLTLLKHAEVWQQVLEPGVFLDELLEPVSHGTVGVFRPSIDEVILEMDASFWQVTGESRKLIPSVLLVLLCKSARLCYRQAIRSSPWTRILDVVVARHVLRDDRDLVSIFGEKQCRRQTGDSSSVASQLEGADTAWRSTCPSTVIFAAMIGGLSKGLVSIPGEIGKVYEPDAIRDELAAPYLEPLYIFYCVAGVMPMLSPRDAGERQLQQTDRPVR